MRIPQDEEADLGLLGRRGPRAVALRLGRMQPGRGRMPFRRRMPRRDVRPELAPFLTAGALLLQMRLRGFAPKTVEGCLHAMEQLWDFHSAPRKAACEPAWPKAKTAPFNTFYPS